MMAQRDQESGQLRSPGSQAWAKPVAICLLCAALLWLVVIRGYADYLASPAPGRAAVLNSLQPTAVTELAADAMGEDELGRATELAERIASHYPFEGRALRVLGAIEERQGNQSRAERLMRAAAAASPRDTATQYWLALHALSDQDLDQALQRLDRVLRFQPEAMRELFPLLGTVAANPFGARKLLPYLEANAAWRSQFLARFVREAQPINSALEMERLLESTATPLTAEESAVITERLLQSQDWDRLEGRIAKRSGYSPRRLRDPTFSAGSSAPLLGWESRTVKGADVIFGARDESGAPSLQITFLDRRVAFEHVRQLLMIESGAYRLKGKVKLDQLQTPRGLVWTLRCVGHKADPLAQSEFFVGRSPWRDFTFDFRIPGEGCPAQWLTLEVAARIDAERQLAGTISFTDFLIEPIPPAIL